MTNLIACHECDLILHIPSIPSRGAAFCTRCGSLLVRSKPNSIERSVALAMASLILYVVAVSFPFLAMKSGSFEQQTSLVTGMYLLYKQGMGGMAFIVVLTCMLFPLLQTIGLLYILIPGYLGRRSPMAAHVFRYVQKLQPWSMMEVFMLAVLVSLVKLAKLAEIIPGPSLWAFALLIFINTVQASVLDAHKVWQLLETPNGQH